jgi:RNase P/RNase MRP subunit p29
MRKIAKVLAGLTLVCLIAVAAAVAESADKYQVTGPVLEVTDTMIAVQKGKDRWEVARDAGTKVTGDLKKGSKVTIKYRMVATTVEVKPEAAKKSK